MPPPNNPRTMFDFESIEWSPFFELGVPDFSARDFCETLDGGQAFTWHKTARFSDARPEYAGTFCGTCAKLRLADGNVEISVPRALDPDETAERARDYLDAGRDYPKLRKRLRKASDPILNAALDAHPTLRILRQNPADAIVCFICSSSKRIVQIKQCAALLAEELGEKILPGVHALPNFERIADAPIELIRQCKLGFRADYLKKSAQKICEDGFDPMRLRSIPYAEAKEYLLSLRGIGDKVADCILLFGAARFEAFPVDTWIRQAMTKLYRTPDSPNAIRAFAAERFGSHAGFAQQLIFADIRKK